MPTPVRLADLTTLRLGGPAPELVTVTTATEVADAMRTFADQDVLVLGGGSNLVVSDAGVPGPVLRVAIPGVRISETDGGALVTIGAGEDWDGVVAQLVDAGLTGLAPLSGIPGRSGATPVQNVGAYGTEIAELLESVTLYDRHTGEVRSVVAGGLELAYRSSVLRGTDRAVVLSITLRLTRTATPVKYAELARTLGVEPGRTAPESEIRAAVLQLRRSKGMVIEPGVDDPDTRSAGSFFTNPILDDAQLSLTDAAIRSALGDVGYPRYPAGHGRTKLSAAWLIERAGFSKGYDGPGRRVGVSSKHTLALVNRGDGTTADLVSLAREIRDGVHARFAVQLHPEPVFVRIGLD